MKTLRKAALLLLGSILLSQASLAEKPDNTGTQPEVDCEDFLYEAAVCGTDLQVAHSTLATYRDAFISRNAEKNYNNLRCKAVLADIKVGEEKFDDAFKKLDDSYYKIKTLLSQRKISDQASADAMASAFDTARGCVDGFRSP